MKIRDTNGKQIIKLYINPNISLITLIVNSLNIPTKRQRFQFGETYKIQLSAIYKNSF
jgi:hypothetical protein